MDFKSTKGIFQQIGDSICEKIISGELSAGDKLPSVREQASIMGVNQNTIMRTYTELQRDLVLDNKRGIGFFVSDTAVEHIRENKRADFFKNILPEFVKQVEVLQLKKDDLSLLFDLFAK